MTATDGLAHATNDQEQPGPDRPVIAARLVFGLASAARPLLGGFFADNLSWRWTFYINLPIGAVALIVTSVVLRLATSTSSGRLVTRSGADRGAILPPAGRPARQPPARIRRRAPQRAPGQLRHAAGAGAPSVPSGTSSQRHSPMRSRPSSPT